MIGVIANPSDRVVVREFFELFKTPWEFYQGGRHYDVLLCNGTVLGDEQSAQLVLIYAGKKLCQEMSGNMNASFTSSGGRSLLYDGMRIPIYGSSVTFQEQQCGLLVDAESREPVLYFERSSGRVRVRIGYDLFREIQILLTAGQPASHASSPTLDLHIAVLRDLIVASGAPLVEIPPVPEGYRFIACLTHDVDHPSIRQHRCDHTMFGFLYRAVFHSLVNLVRGRANSRQLLSNWMAALKLPFVHLGLARDCWREFDRYTELEAGCHSSFFVVPFKDDPGRKDGESAPQRRASRYAARDITGSIQKLMSAGCEIGLHGIDAWWDSFKGREELEQIRRITGVQEIGVRMHWLYFDEQSPVALEEAGVDYDSTIGYNETVGYRAGTSQAYKPVQSTRLIELPLHIMDTALFFPAHLDLSPREASKLVGNIIDHAVRFGGSVTINWHDRSIAPERCWGDFYVAMVDELKSRGAWFATAADTVAWFRKRRSATIENVRGVSDLPHATVELNSDYRPALQLRVYNRA